MISEIIELGTREINKKSDCYFGDFCVGCDSEECHRCSYDDYDEGEIFWACCEDDPHVHDDPCDCDDTCTCRYE